MTYNDIRYRTDTTEASLHVDIGVLTTLTGMENALTVEEAAEILNVRPVFVQTCLDTGDLPSLYRDDVMVYQRYMVVVSELAMLRMVRDAEAHGLYRETDG